MFEPKVHTGQTDLLVQALLALENEEDAYRFLEDLCTIPEIRSISQRLEVALLLRHGEKYTHIADRTGASTATISRVNRALSYGADGYNRVLNRLKGDGEWDGKQSEAEEEKRDESDSTEQRTTHRS